MKHRLGWTYGKGPSRWSFPTQPKHACSPQKQLHCERDWYRDLAAETFCPPRVRSPPPWRTCVFPCPPSPLSYPDFPAAAGSSPTVSAPSSDGICSTCADTFVANWRYACRASVLQRRGSGTRRLPAVVQKKTPKRLLPKSQAKKSHSLEWLFLCVWSGKRDVHWVFCFLILNGFILFRWCINT